MTDAIGWTSAFILVLTIAKQVYDQWKDGRSEGVSTWLFAGQLLSAVGFAIYSWILGNAVYVAANGLTFAASIAGILILIRNRRRNSTTGR